MKFVSQKLKMEVKTETDYGHTKYAYFATEYCLKCFNYNFQFVGIAFLFTRFLYSTTEILNV